MSTAGRWEHRTFSLCASQPSKRYAHVLFGDFPIALDWGGKDVAELQPHPLCGMRRGAGESREHDFGYQLPLLAALLPFCRSKSACM